MGLQAILAESSRCRDRLSEDQIVLQGSISEVSLEVRDVVTKTDLKLMNENCDVVCKLYANVSRAQQQAITLAEHETILGSSKTDTSQLGVLSKTLEPHYTFWTNAAKMKEKKECWLRGPFTSLSGDAMENDVSIALKALTHAGKEFSSLGLSDCSANCDTIYGEVEELQQLIPLVQALRNPGLRDRHWQQIAAVVGSELLIDNSFTLATAQERGLLDHLPSLQKIADTASREWAIENALNKMEADWEHIHISLLAYRETGTFILKLDASVMQILDDHSAMTQSMAFSPHLKPFQERLHKWDTDLHLCDAVLEAWLSLQRGWLYLEPVFAFSDLGTHLPTESKRFSSVDRIWRKVMTTARQAETLLKFCCSQKLLDQLREADRLLQTVHKGLADYLEMKRLGFGRLFFLSNDELLVLLSQSQNPLAITPHLRKCFEAVNSVEFGDELKITALRSHEGELLYLHEPFNPTGLLEIWLKGLEQCMVQSVKTQMLAAMEDYVQTKRTIWARRWPAMVVLAVSSIFWSQSVEEAFQIGGLANLLQRCSTHLLDFTAAVGEELTPQEATLLSALITLDVHARDITEQLLDKNIASRSDFDWLCQLRYYWRDDVFVEMVHACVPYGYEYLGNTPRLVITPLTDRCYMTLMSALTLHLGGAPSGPAGTGKTETVKDLAKGLAKQCVVFNCSDGLDYLAMGKFFKGLASSGAWACFDEFNRIDLEVLSVVAQQIRCIQMAVQTQLSSFVFEGTDLQLNPACSVYITMNPGYAGRAELPDNLKSLFRPCAMMVPDYAFIAEICLYSYGYTKAKPLAQKLVATFKLASEQLSSQNRYDFGMRAIKSVIAAAGAIKGAHPTETEESLLLRGIIDVNVPKFGSHDVILFQGILEDLFMGSLPFKADNDALLKACEESCQERHLCPSPGFLAKVMQLYETMLVRHGLMLVGSPLAGKTCAYRVLQAGICKLAAKNISNFEGVKVDVINPKAVTMGELYGEVDVNTHEWTDGVLPNCLRDACATTSKECRWILFDGPVDALWVENMNTTLDDNKKLCLVSGEIITLRETTTIMFEVDDLADASPATVSRCGMIYMEPSTVGVLPLLTSWIASLPQGLVEEGKVLLEELAAFVVPETVVHMEKAPCCPLEYPVNALALSCFRLLETLLQPLLLRWQDEVQKEKDAAALEKLLHAIAALFIFSVVWSFGALCDQPYRTSFDSFFRSLIQNHGALYAAAPPLTQDLFCWVYDQQREEWVDWMDRKPHPGSLKMSEGHLLVPTVDTLRHEYLLSRLMTNNTHVLCWGGTSTGKTLTIRHHLNLHASSTTQILFNATARTSAREIQNLLDTHLERRRKDVYGPPAGRPCAVFLDDVSMLQPEKYGAFPALEILRLWFDHGGWYDLKPPCAFRNVVDMQIIAAMQPSTISPRFARHFHVLTFNEASDDSMRRIFSTILGSTIGAAFVPVVIRCVGGVVDATLDLYKWARSTLLPMPSRPHYNFSLRDVARVVQGICRADPAIIQAESHVASLWVHEAARVFGDRLVCDEDSAWLRKHQEQLVSNHFPAAKASEIELHGTVYSDISGPGCAVHPYRPIKDRQTLFELVEKHMGEFCAVSSKGVQLALYWEVVEHIARLCRVLRLPQGHTLLLGVGGTGRQSLARLAAFIQGLDTFQIAISKGYGRTEWRDDLKRVIKKAALEERPTLLLLTDSQVVDESFLEDVNNLLNIGEVQNLMNPEDMEKITDAFRAPLLARGAQPTKQNLLGLLTDRTKANLHVVFCMSPSSKLFRQRLRLFPALINCCSIDWFNAWPEEALCSVATSAYQDVFSATSGVTRQVVSASAAMHQIVVQQSHIFFQQLQRRNHVTPTSYLTFLSMFKRLLSSKQGEINKQLKRLENGVSKLESVSLEVNKMQKELKELQPRLEQTAKDVDDVMLHIATDRSEASTTQKLVAQQEQDANAQAAKAAEIAESAQKDLDEALPALDAALASLNSLSRNDIVEVKAMSNPPAGVKMVMEAACIMLDEKPKMVEDPSGKPGKKVAVYWDTAKRILNDPSAFLGSLLEYGRDSIPEAVIQKITPFMALEEFKPEHVAKVSKACTSICMWVRAMFQYHNVTLSVAPKRAALAAAEAQREQTVALLTAAQSKLKAVEANIKLLEGRFADASQRKAMLAAQVAECIAKLSRAEKLTVGLSDERVRWKTSVEQLQRNLTNVVGDMLIAGASVAYLGAFTPAFRQAIHNAWCTVLDNFGLVHSNPCTITATLLDALKAAAWAAAGLPTDEVALENAIILSNSTRWPLMIDPQGQANRWIKNLEKPAVVKPGDKDLIRVLENGIRFGRPVLLQSVGNALDPALEPLLLKQTFQQNGSEVISLGGSAVPYHPDFRFYMSSKVANPDFPAELALQVAILNFTATQEGLEQQLLHCTVSKERPDLAEIKAVLLNTNAKMRGELLALEDHILELLSQAKGNVLDDETLNTALAQAKMTSNEIALKMEEAEKTEREIDAARNQYKPVAVRATVLYFTVAELTPLEPMYHYSLAWFTALFLRSISATPMAETVEERTESLNDGFTYAVYINVVRSLFEVHKLMFAFKMACNILQAAGAIDQREWNYLVYGPTAQRAVPPKPAHPWLTQSMWQEVVMLSQMEAFKAFAAEVAAPTSVDQDVEQMVSDDAELQLQAWQSSLTPFQQLCVVRCLRPDKMARGIRNFVRQALGPRFLEPPASELAGPLREANCTTPIILILSSGADPMSSLLALAEKNKMEHRLDQVSLGQGQGSKAEHLISMAMERGHWVCLQNCHLAESWMPTLERLIDAFSPETCHRDFRLWLTTAPAASFPAGVLQTGIKITLETPQGIKANLRQTVSQISEEDFSCGEKSGDWRHLLYATCLFHAVLLERRKFAALGWNNRYDFTEGDLSFALKQMKNLLISDPETVPFNVIRFLYTEIGYGGRLVDEQDLRIVRSLADRFICPGALEDTYAFSPSGTYVVPACSSLNQMNQFIHELPPLSSADVLGMHPNAAISCDQNEANGIFNALLAVEPRQHGTASSEVEGSPEALCIDLLSKVPKGFDMGEVSLRYPLSYNEIMNTVLQQECERYNHLLGIVEVSLLEVVRGLRGQVVLTPALEAILDAVVTNQVPQIWSKAAYPSVMRLASWMPNLAQRVGFIATWIAKGTPVVFWLSGVFFPQAILTANLQNYARSQRVPVDTLGFAFEITKCWQLDPAASAAGSFYIDGLYLEAARWDHEAESLVEAAPRQLFCKMPLIKLSPGLHRPAPQGSYLCPVYKTIARTGQVSSTGQSNNLIRCIDLPSKFASHQHWVERGVALFTSLAE